MSIIRWRTIGSNPSTQKFSYWIREANTPEDVICPTCAGEIIHNHLIGGNSRHLESLVNCSDCMGTHLHPMPPSELCT